MVTKPLIIAIIATGLSVSAFSPQASADPVGGAIVGGAIGAAVGGPPGAAVGAILGTAIGTDMDYHGHGYAYGPAPYYEERYLGRPLRYAPRRAYYEHAPVYYAPRVAYARPAYVYRPRRHYFDRPRRHERRQVRGDFRRYR